MPNILLVEDEDHLAIGIRYNLTSEGLTVTTAADGQEALAILNEPNADIELVVLDVMLPGMSGYAVCEELRSRGCLIPVVMLTARTLVEDRIRGFNAGADVYLQKPFDLDELLSVIRSLLSRRKNSSTSPPDESTTSRSENSFAFGKAHINFDTWEAYCDSRRIRLTALEMKLLRYLIEHEGLVLSRTELLKNVWGMDRAPATRTVDTFMLNLRKSFEENPSQPRHFLSVRGAGYRFISESIEHPET
ncbi:MAG TPA: DNA-binding response regulator [Planctomycetaceae bacterium]|nr:DNA-binding response regulator [Planctomycetaceae bacterium]|tara:strand:+ start:355 stop:1095 length:741 start_codon:yes stop_codon:yes gene_type:complete